MESIALVGRMDRLYMNRMVKRSDRSVERRKT